MRAVGRKVPFYSLVKLPISRACMNLKKRDQSMGILTTQPIQTYQQKGPSTTSK